MKRARRAAAADPSLSVHQHFPKAGPQLFQQAKRPPKQGTPHDQLMPIEENDDEPDEADTDVELDHEDDAIGPGPDCDAVSHGDRADGYLRPRAYDLSGANVATNPAPAVVGRSSGSYDPRARPASARVPRSSFVVDKAERAREARPQVHGRAPRRVSRRGDRLGRAAQEGQEGAAEGRRVSVRPPTGLAPRSDLQRRDHRPLQPPRRCRLRLARRQPDARPLRPIRDRRRGARQGQRRPALPVRAGRGEVVGRERQGRDAYRDVVSACPGSYCRSGRYP
jgi:hypothetical protein